MRRITLWLLSTLSALVLLFGYHTSTGAAAGTSIVAAGDLAANGTVPGAAADPSTTPTPTPTTSATPDSSGPTSTATPTPTTPSAATTVTGDAVRTRYGPVQVEITVVDGTVTKSVVTQVPWSDGRDQEINGRAVPLLNAKAVHAQSADIDMVSGATYTSQGYISSLQSALDRANL